jgi:hypothetical protein
LFVVLFLLWGFLRLRLDVIVVDFDYAKVGEFLLPLVIDVVLMYLSHSYLFLPWLYGSCLSLLKEVFRIVLLRGLGESFLGLSLEVSTAPGIQDFHSSKLDL